MWKPSNYVAVVEDDWDNGVHSIDLFSSSTSSDSEVDVF